MSHLNFSMLAFFTNFKVTCLITLFDRKPQVFKNSPKLTFFVIFIELLPTQNVNVACFAHNVEGDFLSVFANTVIFCEFYSFLVDLIQDKISILKTRFLLDFSHEMM